MNEATTWLTVCKGAAHPSLVQDPWCRSLLSEAAAWSVNCGIDGIMWHFRDGSKLLANSRQVRVLESAR